MSFDSAKYVIGIDPYNFGKPGCSNGALCVMEKQEDGSMKLKFITTKVRFAYRMLSIARFFNIKVYSEDEFRSKRY